MANLNPKQKAFAEHYLALGNAYQAAIKAGYSENYAKAQSYDMLDRVGIKQYIEERSKSVDQKRIASADEVLEYLTRVVRGEEKDAFGLDVGVSDRTKAAELLGKRYALFRDKLEVTDTSVADALKKARERAKKHGDKE